MTAANRKKPGFKVALGGIITAFALILLLATGLVPIGTYALPGLAGALLIAVVVELGAKWGYGVYAATSLLALLITPDREAALMFVFFFGHYPILKALIERLGKRFLEWVLKSGAFNVCVLVCYGLIFYVFGMQDVMESFGEFGEYSLYIFWGAGNVAFWLYDITLSSLVTFYLRYLRQKLFSRI